jgi:hypothetical protein
MTLVIDLSPELERRLRDEARERGLELKEYARRVLESHRPPDRPGAPQPVPPGDYPDFSDLETAAGISDLSEAFDDYRFGRRRSGTG